MLSVALPAAAQDSAVTVNALDETMPAISPEDSQAQPSATGADDVVVTPAEELSATAAPSLPAEPGMQATTSITPLPSEESAQGEATGGDVMGNTGAAQQHSGQYYDSVILTPDSQLANSGAIGPRKVDPKYEPGQRFMIVERRRLAQSFEARYVAATRALKLGRYAAAMEMFEKLYQLNNRDPRIMLGLAVSQQGAVTQSAARTYEDLLRIDPENEAAIVNLMGIMKSQYPSVTIQNLMELRDKFPTNPGIPAQIGLANAELKNYDDALRYLEIAASMEPSNAIHMYNMAIVTDMKGDARNAIRFYENALQIDATYGSNAKALPREQIYDRLSVLRRKV